MLVPLLTALSIDGSFRVAASVLPVATFLFILILLDSYKLVRPMFVAAAVLYGLGVAFVGLLINVSLLSFLNWDTTSYSRYAAPVVEEILKAAGVVYLIRSRRVGFMVDAAIYGFAIGAGFAVSENLFYLQAGPHLEPASCILRGFGTAFMHGGTTALFGILSAGALERHSSSPLRVFAPGLAIAIVVHSLFNHFLVSPVLSAAGMVAVLPVLVVGVFRQSERALRSWLGLGFDTDAELLEMITTGQTSQTPVGEYLESLRKHFPGDIILDLQCFIQLHVELSIRAKGKLLMRQAGFEIPTDPEVEEKLEEIKVLVRNIGRTGRLAVAPVLRWNERDLWQLHMAKR